MEQGFFSLWRRISNAIFDLFFPPVCLHCHQRIQRQSDFLCSGCNAALEWFEEPLCPCCGYPQWKEDCDYCNETQPAYTQAVSVFPYIEALRTLVHDMKYRDMPAIAEFLAMHALVLMERKHLFPDVDMITAVPMYRTKKRQRGYNQADLLAQEIGKLLACPVHLDIVQRKHASASQTSLAKSKRWENVSSAFRIKKSIDLKRQNILLLDDVFTTGATVQAVCQQLRMAQVGKIYVLTIGRA